jgi:hypothetical protein
MPRSAKPGNFSASKWLHDWSRPTTYPGSPPISTEIQILGREANEVG